MSDNIFTRYGDQIDEACKRAVREALLKHKRAGNPVAVIRNGEIVLLQPNEIALSDTSLDVIWDNEEDDVYAEMLLKK
ncbi:hypothetical protein BH10ACI3_BH10ACI3_08850 [soil metagenome]